MTGGDVLLPAALRAMAVRQVLLALSRFGGQVLRVTVSMTQPANPLGGVDQSCRMRAWLQAHDDVRSHALNGHIESAVGRAAARLAKRVTLVLDGTGRNGLLVSPPVVTRRNRRRRP